MILEDVGWVVEHSRHVRIDQDRIALVCAALRPDDLHLPDWRLPVVPPWRDERLVDWILLFCSVNFCYWGEPKWTVAYGGQSYDGAFGMMACLTRALGEGLDLLDGVFLGRMTKGQFEHIMRGNVPIPLQGERLAIWRAVGAVLTDQFGGHWHQVVSTCRGSAVTLVRTLVRSFPTFDDAAAVDGRPVGFYKRAQLAAGMLYQAFGMQSWGAFHDMGQLTVYADYKLPQVLRRLGILVYDPELASIVDGRMLLPAGSRMEVEIRAATVWSAELMRRVLLQTCPGLTACHVDYWLWQAGQIKSPLDKPYHRTVTTAY